MLEATADMMKEINNGILENLKDKSTIIKKATELNIDSKNNVMKIYPTAVCLKFIGTNKHIMYRISIDENSWLGYSTKSQTKAWENAWNVINRKMLKKLAW